MALNIDLEGFGFLSDSDVSKLSPTLKQQPPISPIESESSSGISSLDSDDLKKQLLSSPSISHDDEDQHSDGVVMIAKEDEEKDSEDDEEDDDDEDQLVDDGEANENQTETTDDEAKEEEEEIEATPQTAVVIVEQPPMVVYQKRDVLDLANNLIRCDPFVQFTVLPENNVNCFFQNRAQYWRLSSSERQEHSLEKCPCCDFTYPSAQQPVQGPMPTAKNANAITDSLKTFLKSNEQMTAMPIKRPINNAQYGGYQMPQQQQQQPQAPQQYQSHNNGFYNNTATNYNQAMNPFMNSGSGFGTTLALLNMMNNASRSAASAFQAMSSNNSSANRYFNNVNNGHGLYKQF